MNEIVKNSVNSKKKLMMIIIVGLISALAVCGFCAVVLSDGLGDFLSREEKIEFPPLDPDSFAETKGENFDIMEYDEYLSLDRTVTLENKDNGSTLTLEDSTYKNYGKGVALVYEMLDALIAGDVVAYNSMVSEEAGHYEWFSQQQIYKVSIWEKSKTEIETKNGNYTEYVIVLKYMIHENNGSYRNNIASDSARPQYIVINDSTGKLMVMDIIDTLG